MQTDALHSLPNGDLPNSRRVGRTFMATSASLMEQLNRLALDATRNIAEPVKSDETVGARI